MKFKKFAALPYRMRDNAVEILLITTRKKGAGRFRKVGRLSESRLNKRQRPKFTKKPACAEPLVTSVYDAHVVIADYLEPGARNPERPLSN
jgi:hypothetical protein